MADRSGDVTRILVAGIGLIGRRHLAAVVQSREARLVGVIDPDPGVATMGAPRFDDIDAVDVQADAIILATPSNLHAAHAAQAAARGWHMLIEKPVAGTLAEADQIIAAAEKGGVKTLIGHHRRHHASVAALRRLIGAGAIGRPVVANCLWAMRKPDVYFETLWRQGAGGSPLMINLVHEIDLLRFVLGEVSEVSAMGGARLRGAGRVESGALTLGFANGAVATITFADTAPSPWGFEAATGENPNIASTGQDMLFIAGTKGAISFPSLNLWQGAADWSQAPQKRRVENPGQTDALAAQLAHFVDVAEGRQEPLIDAADGRATLDVVLRAEQAIGQGARRHATT